MAKESPNRGIPWKQSVKTKRHCEGKRSKKTAYDDDDIKDFLAEVFRVPRIFP
jgi:hypothetical protein